MFIIHSYYCHYHWSNVHCFNKTTQLAYMCVLFHTCLMPCSKQLGAQNSEIDLKQSSNSKFLLRNSNLKLTKVIIWPRIFSVLSCFLSSQLFECGINARQLGHNQEVVSIINHLDLTCQLDSILKDEVWLYLTSEMSPSVGYSVMTWT